VVAKMIPDLEFISVIDSGAYGVVERCNLGNSIVAVKRSTFVSGNDVMFRNVMECAVLQHLDHPNIIKPSHVGIEDNEVVMVMPYISDRLEEVVSEGRITSFNIASIMYKLIDATLYMAR
jgi:hypothetical protein